MYPVRFYGRLTKVHFKCMSIDHLMGAGSAVILAFIAPFCVLGPLPELLVSLDMGSRLLYASPQTWHAQHAERKETYAWQQQQIFRHNWIRFFKTLIRRGYLMLTCCPGICIVELGTIPALTTECPYVAASCAKI